MKSVSSEESEIHQMRRTLGDIHEDMIFLFIFENRIQGVLASQIIKNIKPKLSRQTIHSHLNQLVKKHRIYKDERRRYFPKNSPLNEISTMSQKLNDVIYFTLDPVFSLDPSKDTNQNISDLKTAKLYSYPGFKISHDFRPREPSPLTYFMNKMSGPILSKRYCRSSIRNQEKIEKILFEFINRIGSYITYVFIESLRPISGHEDLSYSQQKELSMKLISETLPLNDLFNTFQYLISNLDLAGKVPESEYKDIFELDKRGFQKLSNAYRLIYPKMYEGLENWQYHTRAFWLKLDTYLATIKDCNHIWEDYTLDKIGKCYHCRACDLITEQKINKNSSEHIKQRVHDSVFV